MGKEMTRTAKRDEILEKVRQFLVKEYETDVLFTGSGEIMMPSVDDQQEEYYFTFKASIPRGKRNGNGGYVPYDGYEAAEEWKSVLDERADEARARQEKKERAEKEKIRKANAKKIVKKLNEVGLDAMIHEKDDDNQFLDREIRA